MTNKETKRPKTNDQRPKTIKDLVSAAVTLVSTKTGSIDHAKSSRSMVF
jgi:hypothetical protein